MANPGLVLQGGHGGSPWMTTAQTEGCAGANPLQGGHGGSPWMTMLRAHMPLSAWAASMRPRLIAVDDISPGPVPASIKSRFNEATADRRGGRVCASLSVRAISELQGGHGGSPWMTLSQARGMAPTYLALQGGHGGSPWMTAPSHPHCRGRIHRFNEATADRRGGRRMLHLGGHKG